MKKTTKQEITFTMTTETFRHFTFTAVNQEEADKKAAKWARYHGFDTRNVKAVEPTEEEKTWNTCNQYIN